MIVTVTALNAAEVEADGLIVGMPEGSRTLTGALSVLDAATKGLVEDALSEGTFTGKEGQAEIVYPLSGARARRLVLVGLGKDKLTPETWRQAVAAGVCALADKAQHVAVVLPAGLELPQATSATVEAAVLAGYRFHPYMSKPDEDERPLQKVTVIGGDAQAAEAAAGMARAVSWVRDQSNKPGNKLNVPTFAAIATGYAEEAGLTVRRFDMAELEKEGFGCLVGVGKGSVDPPVFLVVEYHGGVRGEAPVVLVGKGITFDTGGISIKPRLGMEEMKTDMHGAATVLATIRVASERKLPLNLVALLPIAENMPNGNAYKPGDILKAYSGLTVEVIDTDAEGRLILADGLAYGLKHYKPRVMIDVATLTGSIIMALGYEATGVFTPNDSLAEQLLRAGSASGERGWRMPMWDVYGESLRSEIADVRQVGKTKGADATNAAMFLKRFVGDTPWAHLDIAGPSFLSEPKHYHTKGSTGVGVRMLIDWLEQDIVGAAANH